MFYHHPKGADADEASRLFEAPFPPLDKEKVSPSPAYVGVSVLDGAVRLSRPADWVIREASLEPEKRYIEYVSPRQVLFTVYERIESPEDPWRIIMSRYEDETKTQGGTFLGQAVPTAAWNAQGRVYDVQRKVPAPKAPFQNFSREYLLRSEHRIVLVQIVRPEESLEPLSAELLRVVETLQVL